MSDLFQILSINFAISALLFLILWLISLRTRDPSYVDSWWGLGVVVLAWSTYAQLTNASPHASALVVIASAWGLRLGIFLFARWRKHGPDRRYAKLAERAEREHGLNFAMFSFQWVFAPQLVLQMIMSLPAQLGQIPQTSEFGVIAQIGAYLAVFGIAFEAIADFQLARFKARSENRGKVMDRGLWRYSRHPNYFGELCCWWGIWVIAFDAGMGLSSLPGPLLITFLLTRVSGAPTTEPHLQRTRPDYQAYKERTSSFIPWPPRSS